MFVIPESKSNAKLEVSECAYELLLFDAVHCLFGPVLANSNERCIYLSKIVKEKNSNEG